MESKSSLRVSSIDPNPEIRINGINPNNGLIEMLLSFCPCIPTRAKENKILLEK